MEEINTGLDLKKWRKRYNIKQNELASAINYNANRISHIERGNETLSPRLKKAVSDYARTILDPSVNIRYAKMWSVLENINIQDEECYELIESLLKKILNINAANLPEECLTFLVKSLNALVDIKELAENEVLGPHNFKNLFDASARKLFHAARNYGIASGKYLR